QSHTTANDATRYRAGDEVDEWVQRDPLKRMRTYLRTAGALTDELGPEYTAAPAAAAQSLRNAMGQPADINPLELFDHVYTVQTPQLAEQRAQLAEELSRETTTEQQG